MGLAFGGGIKIELGSTALNINLKYSIGLVYVDDADTKNSGFSIMAGISF
jgi:opacity protein-like surface antigen